MATTKTTRATSTAKAATKKAATTASAATKATAAKAATNASTATKATATKAAAAAKAAADSPQGEQAKSAAYTALGLGLMGAQKLVAQGKALIDSAPAELKVDENLAAAKQHVQTLVAVSAREAIKVDDAAVKAAEAVEQAMAPIEAKLPTQVRDVVTKARGAAKVLHDQFRSQVLEKVASA